MGGQIIIYLDIDLMGLILIKISVPVLKILFSNTNINLT